MVFTGILEAACTDDELAVLISHGLAHCVARDVEERLSDDTLMKTIMICGIPYAFLFLWKPLLYPIPVIGLMIQQMMIRFRKRESEADYIGMLLASEAGFDSDAAAPTWTKLKRLKNKIPKTYMECPPVSIHSSIRPFSA